MKKWILILAMCLIPISAWAECDDPGGKTFITGCCGSEIELTFSDPSGYSPIDPCQCGDVEGFPYRWDRASCTAIIYQMECGGDVLTYLVFDEGGFTFSSLPQFVPIYTTD